MNQNGIQWAIFSWDNPTRRRWRRKQTHRQALPPPPPKHAHKCPTNINGFQLFVSCTR